MTRLASLHLSVTLLLAITALPQTASQPLPVDAVASVCVAHENDPCDFTCGRFADMAVDVFGAIAAEVSGQAECGSEAAGHLASCTAPAGAVHCGDVEWVNEIGSMTGVCSVRGPGIAICRG